MATALLAAVTASAGCAISATDPSEPTIDPRVTVIPDVTGMIVEPSSLTIPREGNGSLAQLAIGDILVSATGEGFLRRVDAIATTADSIVIATSDAELTDALVDARVTTSVGGDGKADTYQLPAIGFSISNRVVVENPAITAKITTASLSFAPSLDLDVGISDARLDNFEMIMRGRLTGALEFEIDARDVSAGPEIVLFESPPAVFYQQIGPVPVVESVTTSIVLKLQATAKGQGRIRITADALAKLAAGVRYTSEGGWDSVSELSLTTHGAIPESGITFDQIGVRAWLAARADVRLYGIAGPFVAVGPQAEASRYNADGHIGGAVGFRGAAGGGLKFLRVNVPALPAYDLFDVTRPIL